MINIMYNNNKVIGMNNMGGMNPMGINNPQNLMNQMTMDNTALNVKNIIQPYENRIKELEEIIRQKDFKIAVLKQKLNTILKIYIIIILIILENNPMNMVNIMDMNNPMNLLMPNFNKHKGKPLHLRVKYENNISNIVCFEFDKASILREKIKTNNAEGAFVYNFRWIDPELSFIENGIYNDGSIIEVKPIMNLFFDFDLKRNDLQLSDDCPLDLAIIYYLLNLNDAFILKEMINNSDKIEFSINGIKLNINEKTPISKKFINGNIINFVLYQNKL